MKGEFDEYLSVDKARGLLNEFSRSLSVDVAQGPKNIGSINDIDDNLIQAFAAEYLQACESNYVVYPYLN